jgi:hypothetical protein
MFTAGTVQADDYIQYQINVVGAGYSWDADEDILYGNGNESGEVFQAQYEHFDVNKYGRNWFDLEHTFGNDLGGIPGNDNTYVIFANPAFSLSKLSGADVSLGPISDVMLSYRYEKSDYGSFEANNYGILLTWDLPGFQWFETDFYYRKTDFDGNTTLDPNLFARIFYQSDNINVGGLAIKHMATIIYNDRQDDFGPEYVFRPDFFVFLNEAQTLDAGIRLDIHHFENPDFLGGGSETVFTPRAMVRYYF